MQKWIIVVLIMWPVLGHAADPPVKKLVDEAMFQDYLNLKFDEASLKLKQAADLCAESQCAEAALIQAHLGTVYFVGFEDEDRGKKYIATALKADPALEIDPQFSTPRLEKAWNAERKKLGTHKNGGTEGDDDEPARAEVSSVPNGDGPLTVSAVPEQVVRTPVPVFVKVKDVDPRSVVVRYKPFGGKSFKRVRLDRVRDGYGGEIPCLEVGSITGKLAYYVEALDTEGNILAASGSADKPHKTDVVRSLRGDPPHLPGQPPPAQCIALRRRRVRERRR
jgi:hypothetical protein